MEGVLKIINTLSLKNKERNLKIHPFWEEAEFEHLVKKGFAKYEATFKVLAQRSYNPSLLDVKFC